MSVTALLDLGSVYKFFRTSPEHTALLQHYSCPLAHLTSYGSPKQLRKNIKHKVHDVTLTFAMMSAYAMYK